MQALSRRVSWVCIVSLALIAPALPAGPPTTASENKSQADGLWFYADAHAYLNDALPERESRIPELKRLQATGNEEVLSVLLDSTSAQAR
jgi:hypothetical protein